VELSARSLPPPLGPLARLAQVEERACVGGKARKEEEDSADDRGSLLSRWNLWHRQRHRNLSAGGIRRQNAVPLYRHAHEIRCGAWARGNRI